MRMYTLLALLVFVADSSADYHSAASVELAANKHSIISRDVVVEAGDTFSSISRRELGKSGLASLLAGYNSKITSAQLTPGSIVRVPIQVPPRGEFAEVVFVKGTVTATRYLNLGGSAQLVSASHANDVVDATDGNPTLKAISLSRNAKVFAGDLITTSPDGYVSIAFSTGSVINLQPDTMARLNVITCLEADDSCLIEIDTQQGRVTSDVETRNQQPVEFRINTPYASAAVRGTVFDVDASQQLLLGVTEGAVDISAQDQTILLDTGFGVVVEGGSPPGEPIELIPSPVFKRVPARIVAGDTIEWWPFQDAVSYSAVISSDEAAVETLSSFSIGQNAAILDLRPSLDENIGKGDYFLTLRAVDFNGLRGFTSNTRITLAEIDPDIDAVSTNVVREGSEFLVSVGETRPDEALGYEIQISSDAAFSDPLSVDVDASGSAVFRLDEDQVFTRARVLLDPFTVSAFGEPTSN